MIGLLRLMITTAADDKTTAVENKTTVADVDNSG